jgi:hypothetical protein
VRVRTYGFPGCFTRPPGTSTRHHPHEPTASKPVVPVNVLPVQCTATTAPPSTSVHRRMVCAMRDRNPSAETAAPKGWCRMARSSLNEVDAGPGRFEEPAASWPRAFRWLVARPHTSVASLFAARGPRLHPTYACCEHSSRGLRSSPPHIPQKPYRAVCRGPY